LNILYLHNLNIKIANIESKTNVMEDNIKK